MYTKGKWLVKTTSGYGTQIYSQTPIQHIATTHYGEIDIDEAKANARLIAAAPDLLKACKMLQNALTEHRLRDSKKRFSLSIADAAAGKAIAKAEGKEK